MWCCFHFLELPERGSEIRAARRKTAGKTTCALKESEMDGQISIVRPGACDDREIRIIIRLAMGKAITALITPENLALALTGKSDLPVELKLRNVEIKVK